jgi:hypothetical protein
MPATASWRALARPRNLLLPTCQDHCWAAEYVASELMPMTYGLHTIHLYPLGPTSLLHLDLAYLIFENMPNPTERHCTSDFSTYEMLECSRAYW